MSVAKVIVGLGNPGAEFERTRHNTGFDIMRACAGVSSFSGIAGVPADVAIVDLGAHQIALACPTTGMNSSGEAARAMLQHFDLKPTDLIVVYDDVTLPLGKLRFQHFGGAGGHHGIESTIEQLGCRDFDRLKVGVGPDPGGAERYKFVLSPVPEPLQPLYAKVVATSCEGIRDWATLGVDACMRNYNGRLVSV